jgi:hypothetical protein
MRPDTIVGFGETRIHTETASFELRASEVANPRPGDQLTVAVRRSSSRVSRSGAIPIGSSGLLMRDQCKQSPAHVGPGRRAITNPAIAATTPTSSKIQ